MVMFTAKLNKKKIVIALVILGLLICGAILLWRDRTASPTASTTITVKDNQARVDFLKSLGWEVEAEPIEQQNVIIPKEFTGVYEEYGNLQAEQGFDLAQYGGMEAVRYTYKILNYPGEADVVADIIVFRNQVIAGDVQSVALDGFMHGLSMPESGDN